MKEFELIVQIGRKMGGTRGGEIHLEGNEAFVTNVKRSSLYHFIMNNTIGTGNFYAGQALINSESVSRRDDKVVFNWIEKGMKGRAFIPNIDSIKDDFVTRFSSDFNEDLKIPVPGKIFEVIQDLLITKLQVVDSKLQIKQTRSDGSVGFESELTLSSGLIDEEYPDTDEISIFTNDLTILSPVIDDQFFIGIDNDKPMSLLVINPLGKIRALIGTLEYD